jgi:hypothetical protein
MVNVASATPLHTTIKAFLSELENRYTHAGIWNVLFKIFTNSQSLGNVSPSEHTLDMMENAPRASAFPPFHPLSIENLYFLE